MATQRQLENARWYPISWHEMDNLFAEQLNEYRQRNSGMHVALLGTTRGGKTTLATGGESARGLLRHWDDCLVLDTTGDPGPINEYGKPLKRYGRIKGHMRLTITDGSNASREKIYRAISRAVGQGHCCIYGDETRQLADKEFFDLQKILEHIWLFCAKKDISFVGGTQAPRWVPSPLYDQSKAHFIFGMRDRRAMKRLAEISGDVDTLEVLIPQLKRYEFAYVDAINGEVYRSKFEFPRIRTEPQTKRESITKFRVIDNRNPQRYRIG